MKSSLIRGHVMHARKDVHAQRTFRYPVYMAELDLDELPRCRLFSHNRRNLFSLYDADYENALSGARLITNLRVLGYVFNPVSFFIGADTVIAEVNNTYGGRHSYVFGPEQRIPHAHRIGYRRERELFVSPFLHGDATYELWIDDAADAISITMHVDVEGDRVFVARFSGTRAPFTDAALARVAIRYPLMTAQVIGAIHYEALKLHLLGVPYRRPGADHRPIREPRNIVSRASMK